MPRIFLTADWRNLIIISYHAPASLLEAHLPKGLDLDLIDGSPTVSLVGFEFKNTRVFGVPWPGFINFPEWNLRFYVKTREPTPRRGVVFIREFVPSRIVSKIAWKLYNEPYIAAPMRFSAKVDGRLAAVHCEVVFNGTTHLLEAAASDALVLPEESSLPHAIKEHQWGFGSTRDGRTLCYEVTHPTWHVHDQATCRVQVDWAKLYGPAWRVMQDAKPFSSILAAGSAITVSTGTILANGRRTN